MATLYLKRATKNCLDYWSGRKKNILKTIILKIKITSTIIGPAMAGPGRTNRTVCYGPAQRAKRYTGTRNRCIRPQRSGSQAVQPDGRHLPRGAHYRCHTPPTTPSRRPTTPSCRPTTYVHLPTTHTRAHGHTRALFKQPNNRFSHVVRCPHNGCSTYAIQKRYATSHSLR